MHPFWIESLFTQRLLSENGAQGRMGPKGVEPNRGALKKLPERRTWEAQIRVERSSYRAA